MLATLGDTVFEASAALVRTFDGATMTTSARWVAHEVIGQKPLQEFNGPSLRTMSFGIRLDAALGVDPEAEAEVLRRATEAGEVLPFMVGGVDRGSWIVKTMTEVWRRVSGSGVVQLIAVDLSLEEYA